MTDTEPLGDRSLHWHRYCIDTTDPGTCGIGVELSIRNEKTDQLVPILKPDDDPDEECMLCGSPWGPWLFGPTEDDEDVIDRTDVRL